jgi:hypothetical protein
MRHYIDRPRRLSAPRVGRLRRTRFAPVALALPLVTLMWLTIGLPIFAELSTAGSGNGRARDVTFRSEIAGDGSGGDRGGGVPYTVAAATVSPRIVREVRLVRERRLISASAGNGSSKSSGGRAAVTGAVPVQPSVVNPSITPLGTGGTPPPPPPPAPGPPPPPPPPWLLYTKPSPRDAY